jgi:ATP-dependent Clp protease ATP-binding subunit ClpC
VLERFSEPSRRLVMLAQQESRVLQHDYVGTEHLLIAATQVDDRLTAALADLGITTESARAQVARMVAPTGTEPSGQMSFTAEANAAIERARPEALQLGHDYVGPEHVVLGLLSVHDGTMPVLLTRLGVHADAVRRHLLSSFGEARPVSVAEERVVLRPLCPRCSGPLEGNIRVVTADAGDERVRLTCCTLCGAVLGAWPVS